MSLQDPWIPIRPFIDAFNANRKERIVVCGDLVIDECMSAWKGSEKYECIFALPHKTKIMRKPQGIGAELKSLADGESGILLHLELMEGKAANEDKEFCDRFPSSIALTLRVVKHYFGTGITLHADSAFSSVSTAKALRSRGLHFMGCVKTACKLYPKKFFEEWSRGEDIQRGNHKTLKSFITLEDNVTVEPIFAVAWKDKTTKQIICTRGLASVMGNPSVRHRRRVVETDWGHENDRYDIHIPRPQAIEMFFNCFSNIDVHDHYRQGSLAIEKNWRTQTWWHRLFGTLFGMVCTDAFLGYRLERRNRQMGGEVGLQSFKDFLHKLAYQLIHNDGIRRRLRKCQREVVEEDEEPENVSAQHNCFNSSIHFMNFLFMLCFQDHRLLHLKDLPAYAGLDKSMRAKRRCVVAGCRKQTSYYCSTCNDVNAPKGIVPVCNPVNKPHSMCFKNHLV